MSVGRHTAYNLIGSAIPIALSIVTVPLYLKLVGVDRYGVLSIAWLLLGYFGLFDLGLGRATSYRIAALRDASAQERSDTFWAALAINIGMGFVGGILLWGAASLFFQNVFKVNSTLRPEILAAVPLLAISVPIATITGVLTGALQGRERFLETNSASVVSTALFQIFPLSLAFMFGPNLSLLLTGALIARALGLTVLSARCYVELARGNTTRLVKSEFPLLMGYGGWVTLTSIFGPLLVIVDRFLIGATLGSAAVANYSVPFQLAQRIAIVPSALTGALFPQLAASTPSQRDNLSDGAVTILNALFTPIVAGAIFIVGPFLRLWIGATLGSAAAGVGRLLLLGFWANAFALVPFTRLQSSGRPDLVTKALLLELCPYLLSLYFSMRWFGLSGCALVFSMRCVADYFVLSFMAGHGFGGWRSLAVNFSLLCSAGWIASLYEASDWQWWMYSSLLIISIMGLNWLMLPKQAKIAVRLRVQRQFM